MPRKARDVEKMLIGKLKFTKDSNDHNHYILKADGLPMIRTKISFSHQEISDSILGLIHQQLRVRKRFFNELCECTKSRKDYLEKVKVDPFPPFHM